jgi:hypothetical protein
MSRVISLLVALTHLGVVSIPCYEGESTPVQSAAPIQPIASDPHHGRELPARADAHHADHRGTRVNAPHPHPESRPRRADDHHADHRGAPVNTPNAHPESSPRRADDHAHHRHAANHSPQPQAVEAHPYELRAPCLCGCTKSGTTSTTPSSPRIGFALFPPKPLQLPEIAPRPDEVADALLPGPLPDSLDHVPIPS